MGERDKLPTHILFVQRRKCQNFHIFQIQMWLYHLNKYNMCWPLVTLSHCICSSEKVTEKVTSCQHLYYLFTVKSLQAINQFKYKCMSCATLPHDINSFFVQAYTFVFKVSDSCATPSFNKGNRFFSLSLSPIDIRVFDNLGWKWHSCQLIQKQLC